MKKWRIIAVICLVLFSAVCTTAIAQCSICTKTAGQLGEKPAEGLNTGIVYLMIAPFAVVGYIGYKWWKNEYQTQD